MAVCITCNKKIGFSTASYILEGDKTICGNCYDKLKSFSTVKKYENLDEFNQTYDLINKEMIENNFNQESIDYINDYLLISKKRLIDILEEKIEEDELQKYLDNYENVSKEEIRNHFVTTGFDFQGYKITNYIKVVSGECVIGTGFLTEFTADWADFFGTKSKKFGYKLKRTKDTALNDVVISSISLGGNAIIGLSFNYFELGNNMITVIATGTAVTIEKI